MRWRDHAQSTTRFCTHTAFNDGEIVAANLLENDARGVSDRIGAYALYIDSPLGRAGLTEAEVRKTGRRIPARRRTSGCTGVVCILEIEVRRAPPRPLNGFTLGGRRDDA